VQEAIHSRGARLLYLPPNSPDCNPIERMWSKIKQFLCNRAPRSEIELHEAAQGVFQAISTADCKGFFFSAKYAASFMEML